MNSYFVFEKELLKNKNVNSAKNYERFFKKEDIKNDIILGIKVPIIRALLKKFVFSFDELQKLIENNIHEYRLSALLYLAEKTPKAIKKNDKVLIDKIWDFLIKNQVYINTWDLVDTICYKAHAPIMEYKFNSAKILKQIDWFINNKLNNSWTSRTAVVLNKFFIAKDNFDYIEYVVDKMRFPKHENLIKAIGWMLKELGEKDKIFLVSYLKKNKGNLDRKIVYYSLEKFNKIDKEKILSLYN